MRFAVLTSLFVVLVSTVYASPAHIRARNDPTKADSAILKRSPSPIEQSTSTAELLKHRRFRFGDWWGMKLDQAWVDYGRLVEDTGKDEIRKLPDVYILGVPGVDVKALQEVALNTVRKKLIELHPHQELHPDVELLYAEVNDHQMTYFSAILKGIPGHKNVANWPPSVIANIRKAGLAKQGSDDKQRPSPIEQSTSTVQLLKRVNVNNRYRYGPWGLMKLPRACVKYGKSLTGDENMRKLPGVYLIKMTEVAHFENLSGEEVLSKMSEEHKDKEFLDYLYLKWYDPNRKYIHRAYFSFLLKDVPGRWDDIDIKDMKSAFGDL